MPVMDDFKDVLLGQSFRERTWPIVKSNRAYDDVVTWLQANRCPYMYDDNTVKTANEYGIYRFAMVRFMKGTGKTANTTVVFSSTPTVESTMETS